MRESAEETSQKNLPVLVKSPISRVQLAQYAGASGDFNPIHIDEEFAKKSPLKGVIAHGMLSMGFLSEYTEKLAGETGDVKNIKVQFSSIVRPGDVIICRGILTAVEKNRESYELQAINQDEKIVVKGTVVIQINNQK